MKNLTGVILAGGKSSRFGADKALIRFNNKPLINSIYDELVLATGNVFIISNEVDKYKFLNIPVHKDIIPGLGPIGGIYTALNHSGAEWTFITPCDLPQFSFNIIKTLYDHSGNSELTTYSIAGKIQPLPVLIRNNSIEKLLLYLQNMNYSLKGFLEICEKTILPAEHYFNPEKLKSCNTKEDFLKLSGEKSIFVY
ncbi:MAG: molybdenum cofactor guanylyltransferase [bacterium]|nr:molybdenum cofactor guanylyltransferase [bacterium]